jgi:hypothetical protein
VPIFFSSTIIHPSLILLPFPVLGVVVDEEFDPADAFEYQHILPFFPTPLPLSGVWLEPAVVLVLLTAGGEIVLCGTKLATGDVVEVIGGGGGIIPLPLLSMSFNFTTHREISKNKQKLKIGEELFTFSHILLFATCF